MLHVRRLVEVVVGHFARVCASSAAADAPIATPLSVASIHEHSNQGTRGTSLADLPIARACDISRL
jgi:hypothetical protein